MKIQEIRGFDWTATISNSSEPFSYTTTYSNFMFLGRFVFKLSCKNIHKHRNTHTHTHTQRDSNEYSKVAFSKNATINMLDGACEGNTLKKVALF